MAYHFTETLLRENIGHFLPEYTSCHYIYQRGSTKGECCGKPSVRLFGTLPICKMHRQVFKTERKHFSMRRRIDSLARERDRLIIVSGEQPLLKTSLLLDQIPKAIERSTECSVCYKTLDLLSLPCCHVVCFDCYKILSDKRVSHTWKCPVCRTDIKDQFIRRL